jgi:hypothetical protein
VGESLVDSLRITGEKRRRFVAREKQSQRGDATSVRCHARSLIPLLLLGLGEAFDRLYARGLPHPGPQQVEHCCDDEHGCEGQEWVAATEVDDQRERDSHRAGHVQRCEPRMPVAAREGGQGRES